MGLRCLSIHTANATNIITYVSIHHILWQSKPFWADLITLAGQIRQNKTFDDDMWGSSFLFLLFLPEEINETSWSCEAVSDHGPVSSPEKFLGGVDDFSRFYGWPKEP